MWAPMSPSPTTQRVWPRSGIGSMGAQRRARWAARKPSIRCVTQRHQPSAYSAIHGPKMPATRVMITRGDSSGTSRASIPAPMHWIHRRRCAVASTARGGRQQ